MSTGPSARRVQTLVAIGGSLAIAYVLVVTAWMSDDAFITLRTIDNVVNGYGLRWNIDERVQAFTHPAWLIVLTPVYALTREPYFTTLAVQIVVSLSAAWLLMRCVSLGAGQAILVAGVLLGSRALVDFSTSGLENPLTHLVLVLAFLTWRRDSSHSRLAQLTALTSVAALCRAELVLLLAPVLGATLVARPARAVRRLALGGAPLILWTAFSLVYYGAAVPNTALAKLSTGIPTAELVQQGWRYWQATAMFDLVTPAVIVCGAATLAVACGTQGRLMALGLLLYGVFVVRVGGDFMSGRFFTPMVLWALLGLAGLAPRSTVLSRRLLPLAGAAAIIGSLVLPGQASLTSGAGFGSEPLPVPDYFGVTDERHFYYQTTGLLRRLGVGGRPTEPVWESAGRAARARASGRDVVEASNVGMFGYWAGPRVHIVDRNALTDAFLARLPARRPWRIGHFTRTVPEGYVDTWRTGTNQLTDPQLRERYERVRLVTQGSLWSVRRFEVIASFVLPLSLHPHAPSLD